MSFFAEDTKTLCATSKICPGESIWSGCRIGFCFVMRGDTVFASDVWLTMTSIQKHAPNEIFLNRVRPDTVHSGERIVLVSSEVSQKRFGRTAYHRKRFIREENGLGFAGINSEKIFCGSRTAGHGREKIFSECVPPESVHPGNHST